MFKSYFIIEHTLFTGFIPQENISYRSPEVAPVGEEGVFQVGFDVATLRGLDLIETYGCFLFVVEGREHSRPYFGTQILHLGGVEREEVF